MGKLIKKIGTLLLVCVLALSLAACGQSDNSGNADDEGEKSITIAVAAPMTGDNAEYGIGFANAAKLMAKEWNDKGGVKIGDEMYQVKIAEFDDKSDFDEAALIAQKIVSDDSIYGVLGHFASGICMVAAPVYQEAGYVNISPTSSHADYSGIGDYIFRNNTVITAETATGAEIATSYLGKTKVGVLSIDTEWGQSAGNAMEANIAAKGGEMVLRQEVSADAVDFATEIANFRAAGAEEIMVAGMYGTLGPFVVALQNSDYIVPVVGCSNAYTSNMLDYASQAPDIQIYAPVSFFAGNTDPKIQAYVQAYTDAYGAAPSALTTQAYDSVGIMLTALEACGSLDREAMKNAIYDIKYDGMSGYTTFDSIGDAQKVFTKLTIKDGEWALAE
ncbi:MAG: ABC transporter substrate-binding protein [Erysipelotrichaceae bacterium]|nr:ABC transporter substrate-binding protein [Erysipelotrichaceae bacterium]